MNFSLPERVCLSVGIVDALMLRLASRVRVFVCVFILVSVGFYCCFSSLFIQQI